MTELTLTIRPEHPGDHATIDRLHARAFGPGRFARTAFRLREGVDHDLSLSFAAHVGTLLVGSVRLSPVWAGNVPALVLGPLTVEPAFKERGIGGALMRHALEEARSRGEQLVLLVGDAAYYRRFGFAPVPPGRFTLPGPVDPARLLVCPLVTDSSDTARGEVRPRLDDR
ncbi:N-acetyltransferase [Saliniramus sp.]|uniref:GNAT family N-acetyltransferase n=1 Tax=Saliniramus sp. TaxID=2986772 RepID=UPI002C128161|nr:N-acetyltransferase [Saliniramus sp.]HMB11207.1 N-acetyltransferase [Saliniramus sp.]